MKKKCRGDARCALPGTPDTRCALTGTPDTCCALTDTLDMRCTLFGTPDTRCALPGTPDTRCGWEAAAEFAGLISEGRRRLSEAGLADSARDVETLLYAASGYSREKNFAHSQDALTGPAKEKFFSYIERRAKREPVQYIIGEWEFMGLPFIVGPDVLIPRPDTECLAEFVIGELGGGASILDLCTGSGCIAISLAVFLRSALITAADISAGALRVAAKNAGLNNVSDRIVFLEGDMFAPLPKGSVFDAICANPPYIPKGELALLPEDVRAYEPAEALDGGVDGLDFYYAIAAGALGYLNSGGLLAVEVGAGQAGDVRRIFNEYGLINVRAAKDINGIERVVSARSRAGVG